MAIHLARWSWDDFSIYAFTTEIMLQFQDIKGFETVGSM